MVFGKKIDRRQAKPGAFRLDRPLFMQVPRALAALVLTGCALITILASHAAPAIEFGAFFLLLCSFGAWFVGNRFAVCLGLLTVSLQMVNGHAPALRSGWAVAAFQLCSALTVVLMLGVARAALELEWRFARVDQLTGALNRKAFFEAVAGETDRTGISVLIYADIDGLKRLNDRFGREAGDEALREFANRVRKAIRKDDVFARIGGDEFVLFLRVRDTAAAELVANRLNGALNLNPLDGETRLKCSLGVLILPAGLRSIDAELKQADALMYHAKKESLGLVIAMPSNDDLLLAPGVTPDGQQRAAVRSTERRSPGIAVDVGSGATVPA